MNRNRRPNDNTSAHVAFIVALVLVAAAIAIHFLAGAA